jgi:hypothetical protein
MATVFVNDKPVDIGNERLNLIQAAGKGGVFIAHYCRHPTLLAVALLAGACNNRSDSTTAKELHDLGRAYEHYFITFKKGPASVNDLDGAVLQDTPAAKDRAQAFLQKIRNKSFVVVWNVKLFPLPSNVPPGSSFLAYEKDTPHRGGLVLMDDITVKEITAEEFAAANKAAR